MSDSANLPRGMLVPPGGVVPPDGVVPRKLWAPSAARTRESAFARYLDWLQSTRGLCFDGYPAAWRWSTTELESFWASLWDFFEIDAAQPYREVLAERVMPGARWFPGAELNHAALSVPRERSAPRIRSLYCRSIRPFRFGRSTWR